MSNFSIGKKGFYYKFKSRLGAGNFGEVILGNFFKLFKFSLKFI
jgi:hypothetical protein